MQLRQQSSNLVDYTVELNEVNFKNPLIKKINEQLFNRKLTEVEKVEKAFHYVRDQISHSWDIQSQKVTRKASEVLEHGMGICYAKSNLLAAILRREGIPTGFCYQRLTLFDTPEEGFCIHALNAVYIEPEQKWIRLDARGNKEGIDAKFSLDEEKLAFKVRPAIGEIDYKTIYSKPHPKTMKVLQTHRDMIEIYVHYLPDEL
ncbi:transglutaminase [Alkalihalobacillus alcalophilus ATCC 27647 = CGMCC 1.3604]|uniref:Transglutaminase n=1 Tax=Alkalihalobacillus alcalophilus ATCC 27647 = CGMCC 1.3604 TaxID=1218173 RepID=A0A4S4JWB5_ALKAL|nr:transglutaminase family protein [Alkalihalobacillus alcalophilus]MED1562367.1 transglutaminase family protein [Alkalihalobacillus alcalophilus]THG88940.1 transglutaminase [Alkalihalobacillus alcalophilus ATCC 27647 = CGMCC 1.3604]